MKIAFWILLGTIFYIYLGYPVLLGFQALLLPKPWKRRKISPSVSVVMSVYNEQDIIEDKIKNLLKLDYPRQKLEILIGSDGSSDKTNEIIGRFDDSRIKLLSYKRRAGKIAVLNKLIAKAKGQILFFTDARQILYRGCLKEIVKNFADSRVGSVSGELVFYKPGDSRTAQGVNFYWNYEKWIRENESITGSMVGATGAVYAIRKELYSPPPPDTVLDDVYIPLEAVEKGYRAVFDRRAKGQDEPSRSAKEEFRRKTRTLAGNYQIFTYLPKLLIPLRSRIWFRLISHKLLRVLAPFFLIALYILNIPLISEGAFYYNLFLLQSAFYLVAIFRLSNLPYFFCLLNVTAVVGLIRFLLGTQDVKWIKKAR